MRIGIRSHLMTAALGVAIAFVAKDLAMPLLAVSLMGLFDRLVAAPLLRV